MSTYTHLNDLIHDMFRVNQMFSSVGKLETILEAEKQSVLDGNNEIKILKQQIDSLNK